MGRINLADINNMIRDLATIKDLKLKSLKLFKESWEGIACELNK